MKRIDFIVTDEEAAILERVVKERGLRSIAALAKKVVLEFLKQEGDRK